MIFLSIVFLTAIALSSIAAYFSIVGMLAIFPTAYIPILVMGISLEIAKLVSTLWLKTNWKVASKLVKSYLFFAIFVLMIITAIGEYGFLTKSHLDQTSGTIDNSAKVERLDQQIARDKTIIIDDEKVIAQLDATINSYIGKDRTDKSLAVRKNQTPQRKQLRDNIDASQKRIDGFSDEKLKLQSEVRKQQLDVGPIRYIAELFYGVTDDASKNIEAAVRIFTLLIVLTLDPLAIVLLIAANHTILRLKNEEGKKENLLSGSTNEHMGAVTDIKETPPKGDTQSDQQCHICRDERHKYDSNDTVSTPVLQDTTEVGLNAEEEIVPTSYNSDKEANWQTPPLSDTLVSFGIEENTRIHETLPFQHSQEKVDEEKTPIFSRLHCPDTVPPLPVIRQPRLTRVHSSELIEPVLESAPEKVGKVETPPIATVNILPHGSIMRELFGSTPHFVPQKVNEEEKAEVQGKSGVAINIDANTSDLITDAFQKNRHGDFFLNKYPRALSWLTEFKRS